MILRIPRRCPASAATKQIVASYSSHSSSSSSSSSSNTNQQQRQRRDYRAPLLVGGSLVGASTLQYYLHQRAFSTPATVLTPTTSIKTTPAHHHLKAAVPSPPPHHASVPAAAAAAAAAAFSTTSSSSSPSSSASPSSSSPPPPTPKIKAPSLISSLSFSTSSRTTTTTTTTTNPLEGLHITIYQYKICPFCCKVKAVLDYYKVPYETLDVNPLTKKEIKSFSPDYKKVPIAHLGKEVVRDSSVIVNKISDLLRAAHAAPVKELDAFFSPEAMRWAEWADMELAVLLFPNITRNFQESYQAFSYVQEIPHFSLVDKWSNQLIGATAMWAAQGKIKKKYNITDERAALFTAIKDWVGEVGDKAFLGGKVPNMGDLAVYACIRAIEGLDAHKELMAETEIGEWYVRVENAIGASACVKAE